MKCNKFTAILDLMVEQEIVNFERDGVRVLSVYKIGGGKFLMDCTVGNKSIAHTLFDRYEADDGKIRLYMGNEFVSFLYPAGFEPESESIYS